MFFRLAEELLAAGRFRAHRATVGKGGLYGVLEGLRLMREESQWNETSIPSRRYLVDILSPFLAMRV